MQESCPQCYGKKHSFSAKCQECVFSASCSYYLLSEPHMESRLNMISYEYIQEWSQLAADVSGIPGEEPDEEILCGGVSECEVKGIAQFLRFMLDLDDYTLAILSEIITSPYSDGRCYPISELAKLHKCTRQAMHRKILRSVRRTPELSAMLQLTFSKIRRSRCRFRQKNYYKEKISSL